MVESPPRLRAHSEALGLKVLDSTVLGLTFQGSIGTTSSHDLMIGLGRTRTLSTTLGSAACMVLVFSDQACFSRHDSSRRLRLSTVVGPASVNAAPGAHEPGRTHPTTPDRPLF